MDCISWLPYRQKNIQYFLLVFMQSIRRIYDGFYKEARPEEGLVSAFFDRVFRFQKEGRALDCGAGYGQYSEMLAQKGFTVDVLDISKESVSYVRRRLGKKHLKAKFFVEDILEWKSPSRYDVVVCTAVLHHFSASKREKALRKFVRLLKPGGLLFLVLFISDDVSKTRHRGSWLFFFRRGVVEEFFRKRKFNILFSKEENAKPAKGVARKDMPVSCVQTILVQKSKL